MLAVRIGTNTRYIQVRHEMIMTLTPASNRNIKKIWSVIDSFLKKNEILRLIFFIFMISLGNMEHTS